jgi:hypothetical protein
MAKLAKSVIIMGLEDGNELIQDQYEAEGGSARCERQSAAIRRIIFSRRHRAWTVIG